MTNEQRYIYFESGKLQKATEIELLDWAGYWATAGLDEITDPLQKAQMKAAINLILSDLAMMIRKTSRLAISYDVFKESAPEGVTDHDIHVVVVSIMASKLAWLTGIETVPEA